ncbi:hypothetical protein METBIDRAFT_11246 [Metschnikowia bicuspidata var. bicuspidata NRRL YB-4993]|uniref:Uncharacterized protein n=1 Tax=Metschnikowia bicuspidata var. bicuspidata NRRL YB-4993 TaxID=869754 RepID=A0A1A0HES2_9ASCO|nr:hypothetical protein METBIDRAFT_11246 [Metschnikowia bicuspidata var. bicuspidata NRRL YB-4993]OBA22408.1 hypothetical protein METBIDRAFT_11246 [Metschnikowia bicuspidata var. bicuspidata NRRL YB-4993]
MGAKYHAARRAQMAANKLVFFRFQYTFLSDYQIHTSSFFFFMNLRPFSSSNYSSLSEGEEEADHGMASEVELMEPMFSVLWRVNPSDQRAFPLVNENRRIGSQEQPILSTSTHIAPQNSKRCMDDLCLRLEDELNSFKFHSNLCFTNLRHTMYDQLRAFEERALEKDRLHCKALENLEDSRAEAMLEAKRASQYVRELKEQHKKYKAKVALESMMAAKEYHRERRSRELMLSRVRKIAERARQVGKNLQTRDSVLAKTKGGRSRGCMSFEERSVGVDDACLSINKHRPTSRAETGSAVGDPGQHQKRAVFESLFMSSPACKRKKSTAEGVFTSSPIPNIMRRSAGYEYHGAGAIRRGT